jgi:folate-binding protein YgfZ
MNDIRAAIAGDAVFDLEHLALIAVDGDDALDFLQGQLTNDLCAVTESRAQQSAWCSPKGRVLTCLLVFRHGQRLMLQLPRSLVDQTVKRLRMFVLRARVTLEDVSDRWARIGIVGSRAESCLRDLVGELPGQVDGVRAAKDVTIIRLRGRRPRYEVIGDPSVIGSLMNACRDIAAVAGSDAWEYLDIEAGIANVVPDTSDSFLPQMINLDRVDGISFTKGCYVGQEIVARTQHLGRIKRRMYRAHWDGGADLAPGDTLEGAGEPAPMKAQVVDAKAAPEGGCELLAVIPIDAADAAGPLGIPLRDGSRLTLTALPYPLQDE